MNGEFATGIAALLTAIGSVLIAYNNRKKAQSEQIDAAKTAYISLIKPLQDRVSDLESDVIEQDKRIRALAKENHELRVGIHKLIEQISRLGHEPAWTPKSREAE